MTIEIKANDIYDARHKLGLREAPADIRITWRRGDVDYGRSPEAGCIVDAISIPGEEVKRCFPKVSDAVRYIASMLKKHEDMVREAKKKHSKDVRERLKKTKKAACCK